VNIHYNLINKNLLINIINLKSFVKSFLRAPVLNSHFSIKASSEDCISVAGTGRGALLARGAGHPANFLDLPPHFGHNRGNFSECGDVAKLRATSDSPTLNADPALGGDESLGNMEK